MKRLPINTLSRTAQIVIATVLCCIGGFLLLLAMIGLVYVYANSYTMVVGVTTSAATVELSGMNFDQKVNQLVQTSSGHLYVYTTRPVQGVVVCEGDRNGIHYIVRDVTPDTLVGVGASVCNQLKQQQDIFNPQTSQIPMQINEGPYSYKPNTTQSLVPGMIANSVVRYPTEAIPNWTEK